MLFKKYANPFSFLDALIDCDTLSEFIPFFMQQHADELEWDYYLHKVFNKSFDDFRRQINNSTPPSKENLKTTIQKSKNMLQGFKPA